jgi:hypothetical protein
MTFTWHDQLEGIAPISLELWPVIPQDPEQVANMLSQEGK